MKSLRNLKLLLPEKNTGEENFLRFYRGNIYKLPPF